MEISAVVITRNEEKRLEPALASLEGVVSEIVVVDCFSTDGTKKVAAKYTSRVYDRKWTDFAGQKNYADGLATKTWILSLDADERLSPELREELLAMKDVEPDCAAFSVPFRTWYLGRWIKHSGWRPDVRVRLFCREGATWEGDYIHEKVAVGGPVGRLKGSINHFPFSGVDQQVARISEFSTLEAHKFYSQGKKARYRHIAAGPLGGFLRTYIFRLGLLDGFPGLVIAGLDGFAVFMRYIKLRDIWKKGERIEPVSR